MTAAVNRLDIPGNREQYRRKHMKILLMLIVTLGFASLAFAQATQGEEITLTGTLRGDRLAIGGESTGWMREYQDETGQHTIEVALPGGLTNRTRTPTMVKVTGRFGEIEYVERGTVRVFRASRVENASAPAAAGTASPSARLPQLTLERLNAQQRALADDILKVSSVGLGGPYNSLLRSPELGKRMVALLDYLRFNTSVPRRLNEFAILIQARLWTSQVEWLTHYPLALKEGISEATASDLKAGRRPASMKPDEAAVYDLCMAISTTHAASDATYLRAAHVLNEPPMVDLITLNGTYTT